MNLSVLVFGSIFVLVLVMRIIQNYKKRQNSKKKNKLLTTKDLVNVLFNVGLLTAGVLSVLLSLSLEKIIFGEELNFTQPLINFLAGVLFVWFSIRNIFYGGKV